MGSWKPGTSPSTKQSWLESPVALAVVTLAVHRVTRLLTVDELPPLEAARVWVEDRLPADWAHGVRCSHCAGFWIAAATVAAADTADRHWPRRTWMLAALPWAVASVVGQIADREPA